MPDDRAASPARVLARARELAADVFAPAAMAVEASQQIPPGHLDLLAAEGFYGLAGPPEAGGLDLPLPAALGHRDSQDAQRLAREALYLLVFGSRPTIKQALTGLLTGDGAHAEGAAWRNR